MTRKLRLDPRTKIILCILVNLPIFVFINHPLIYLFVGFAILLLILSKEYKAVFKYLIIYGIIIGIGFISHWIPEAIIAVFGTLIIMIKLFLPFIAFGLLLVRTTSINDIAIVLDKMRLPDSIIIPLLVLFRFIPTIHEERLAIAKAMKLRGIGFGLKSLLLHPVKTVEYMYIPMLFTLIKSGEELTIASLTRGLGGKQRRTYIRDVIMGVQDYVVLSLFFLLIVFVIYIGLGEGL